VFLEGKYRRKFNSMYHGLEVREENVFWQLFASSLELVLAIIYDLNTFLFFCFMYLAIMRLESRAMVQHVQHLKHDQQDGQAKDADNSNKYNNKSGDEVPFKIYFSSSLILSLIIYMLLL
jgi:hypothetical protein